MGVGDQRHAPAAFFRKRDKVRIVYEAGLVLVPVWTSVENLAPTGIIRSPDCSTRNECLNRLRYPEPD
jgi:hypothetical protein